MDNKQDSHIVNKIEIDKSTAEPKIVEVPSSYFEKEEKTILAEEKKKEKENRKNNKPSVGQLSMDKYISASTSASVSQRQKTFKKIFTIIFVVFILGVFVWTFYNDFFSHKEDRIEFKEVFGIIGNNWQYLIFALISLSLVYIFKGLKLSLCCKHMTKKWHLKTCLETGVFGIYYNNITPLAVGGQPFEIYHLSKNGVHGGVAASLPIITFFLNQFAFVILGIIALILFQSNGFNLPSEMMGGFPSLTSSLAIVGLICCMLMPTLVVTFCLMPKFCAKLVHLVMAIGNKLKLVKNPKVTTLKTMKTVFHNSQCIKKIAKSPLIFSLNFLLSFGEQLAHCSIAYFTLKFFGFNWEARNIMEWLQVVQLCLILNSAVSFIPTPGNSGAADLSFYMLFSNGLRAGLVFPAMIVWRVLSFYSTIIIGFIFSTTQHKKERKKQSESVSINNT